MSPLEVLKGARELLSDESRWTKNTFARDVHGDPCASENVEAVCWCAYGAIREVAGCDYDAVSVADMAIESELVAISSSHRDSVDLFNDDVHTSHADILALFDGAIAELESTDV